MYFIGSSIIIIIYLFVIKIIISAENKPENLGDFSYSVASLLFTHF